jgi:hypothetical protein
MIPIRILSLLAYFINIFIDIIIYGLGGHAKVLWNLLDGGLSCNGPLLGSFESMRDGTLGTNPHQHPPSAWQMSRCWVPILASIPRVLGK